VSSPEHPPVDQKTEDRPSDQHTNGAGDDDRPVGRPAPESGGDPADPDDLLLAPIPEEGTTAPADSDRIFGRPSATSPYARIISSAAMSRQDRPERGGPVGPRGPGEPKGRRPPNPREQQRIRSQGRWALGLGISGLLASIIAFPLGLPMGIAAIVLAVLARRAGRRQGQVVAGATPGLVLGIVATAFASVLMVTAAVFWNEMLTYSECMSGANTQTAKEHCRNHVEEQILDRFGQSR
jgi:hypothetical protein